MTSKQVRYIIESTADKVGVNKFDHPKSHPNGSWNQFVGYGRINVLKAVWKATNALFIEARIEATHLQKLALALRAHKKELARDDREDVDPAAGALHETWIRLGSDPGILKLIHDVIQDPGIAYSLRQDHAPLLKDRGIALPEGASVVVIDKVTHEGAQACPVLRIEFTVAGIKCAAEWDPELGFSGETLSPLPGLHKAEVQTAATTREPAGIAGLPGRSVSMQD